MAITVKIEVEGQTEDGVATALRMIATQVVDGYREGSERGERVKYSYEVTGEED